MDLPLHLTSDYPNQYQFMNSEFVHNTFSYDHSLPNQECTNHYQNISDLSTDGVLRYIDNMLMEDQAMDDNTNELLESSDFQAKERSFYEVLGQEYPDTIMSEYECGVVSQKFWKGVEEANKFLPSTHIAIPIQDPNGGDRNAYDHHDHVVTKENYNLHTDEFDTWSCMDSQTCDTFAAYITELRNASNAQRKKSVEEKQGSFDLSYLLISCAQAITNDDHPAANEILKEVKQHASKFGDANQRVAHYLVRGLDARLNGRTGCWMQKDFTYDRLSASDYFTAYCTSLISSSFRRISIFASNKLIAVRSKKSAKVHIIDFGILYGFQWPALIQRLAEREGGPPMLRITGVDFPQPECEPVERIKETKERLVHYAKMSGVPFEYNAILKSWESITVEDLGIEEGEFVAVNCLYRADILTPDDVDVTESPRSKVLDLIRRINPDIFVHGVVNAGFGVPYFMTRFREALFHYSALFDMMETVIPKDRPERELLESILGKQAMNVIACEGLERVERPETCRQWRHRHVRAGLKQVRFERKVLRVILNKVENFYHKEFVVNEDNKWLMMSWKGRSICALSCWQ